MSFPYSILYRFLSRFIICSGHSVSLFMLLPVLCVFFYSFLIFFSLPNSLSLFLSHSHSHSSLPYHFHPLDRRLFERWKGTRCGQHEGFHHPGHGHDSHRALVQVTYSHYHMRTCEHLHAAYTRTCSRQRKFSPHSPLSLTLILLKQLHLSLPQTNEGRQGEPKGVPLENRTARIAAETSYLIWNGAQDEREMQEGRRRVGGKRCVISRSYTLLNVMVILSHDPSFPSILLYLLSISSSAVHYHHLCTYSLFTPPPLTLSDPFFVFTPRISVRSGQGIRGANRTWR